MGITGGESLPCAPLPDQVLLALQGLQTPPTRVSSTRRLAPSPLHSAIQPDPTPTSLPTQQHRCGWPSLGQFSQFRPHIHTCMLTHLFLLCKGKIVPQQDVGLLLVVTARCGAMALLACCACWVPVYP